MSGQTPFVTVKRLACVSAIAILLLGAAISWLAYRIKGLEDLQKLADFKLAAYQLQQERQQSSSEVDWSTVVKSGSGGFQVRLPDGWGPIANDMDSDYLALTGNLQPTLSSTSKVTVQETRGHGKDGPSIFSMVLLAKGQAAPPQGTAEEFAFGKGEDEIKGVKYTHIYSKDGLSGIGTLRLAGDRDYEYILPAPDDKELHVYYGVYGSDPRNLIEVVDEIVRTVTLADLSPADL